MEQALVKQGKGSLIAFLSGAAIASVATLLFAPASGKQTRKRIAGGARKASRAVVRKATQLEHKAERQIKKLQRQAIRKVEKTSKVLAKRANGVRNAALSRVEGALRVHTNGHHKTA
jgi:gas vesicle protein